VSGYLVVIHLDNRPATREELAPFALPLAERGPHGARPRLFGNVGVMSSLLYTGDPRLDATVATIGERLVVAGQVRMDARPALLVAFRNAGRDLTDDETDVSLFAHAWDLWSAGALDRVIGDFSVCVVDRRDGSVTLVRDRFGVRPLFHATVGRTLIASNVLRAVLASPDVSHVLNDDAVADFIASGAPEESGATIFRDVRCVPPAHFVRTGAAAQRYWSVADLPMRAEEDVNALRHAFVQAIGDRLRAPAISVLTSGGIESTAIAAMTCATLKVPAAVHAVTVDLPSIAPSPRVAYVQSVARTLGIRHTVVNGDRFGFHEGLEYVAARLPHTAAPSCDLDVELRREVMRRAVSNSRVVLSDGDPDALLGLPTPSGHGAPSPAWLREDLRRRRDARLSARAADAQDFPSWPGLPHGAATLESLDPGAHAVPADVRFPLLDVRIVALMLSAPAERQQQLLDDATQGALPRHPPDEQSIHMPELLSARFAQWWSRRPMPFTPCDALRRYLDAAVAPPTAAPDGSSDDALIELRLRSLDRWLRVETA